MAAVNQAGQQIIANDVYPVLRAALGNPKVPVISVAGGNLLLSNGAFLYRNG